MILCKVVGFPEVVISVVVVVEKLEGYVEDLVEIGGTESFAALILQYHMYPFEVLNQRARSEDM